MPMSAETNFIPHGRHLRSEIVLGPLSRADLNSRLTCRSVNHQKTTPIEAAVQIDMNCMFYFKKFNNIFYAIVGHILLTKFLIMNPNT